MRESGWSADIMRPCKRGSFVGLLLCLLIFAWTGAQPPVAHGAGPGFCGPTPEDRAPNKPAIHLNHTSGPEGTSLTMSASGWRPGAHVDLHFDARSPKTGELYILEPHLAQGTVAHDGTITLPPLSAIPHICVDASSGANVWYQFDGSGKATAYFVLVSDAGEVSAPVAFEYLAAPTVAVTGNGPYAEQVKVGTTVTVTGTGWEPYEPLTLTLRFSPDKPSTLSYAVEVHALADARGNFTARYPLDERIPWSRDAYLTVEGNGPSFGVITVSALLFLLPAVQPTFAADRALVTPGMTLMISGEHWYPGDTYTLKYCAAQWIDDGWGEGPDCGKEANPELGTVTVDANGRMHQQLRVPSDVKPGVIFVRVYEVAGWVKVQSVSLHVVDHLPTWDEIHPRVAALRNHLVESLPFTIPALLLVGILAFVAVRRWRAQSGS